MKTTIELPTDLYRDVKAEAARQGLTVRELTIALYSAWLDGRAPVTEPTEDDGAVARWVADLDALAARAAAVAAPASAPGAVERVRADRNARG